MTVSDSTAGTIKGEQPEPTIEDLVASAKPIGDLRRFVIDDLTAEEEDEFFAILEDA